MLTDKLTVEGIDCIRNGFVSRHRSFEHYMSLKESSTTRC